MSHYDRFLSGSALPGISDCSSGDTAYGPLGAGLAVKGYWYLKKHANTSLVPDRAGVATSRNAPRAPQDHGKVKRCARSSS
jgi:hypothetical protein